MRHHDQLILFLFQAGNLTVLSTDPLLHQDPVQLDFHFRLTPHSSAHWHGLLCDHRLFLDIPYQALDQGNRERWGPGWAWGRVGIFHPLSCHNDSGGGSDTQNTLVAHRQELAVQGIILSWGSVAGLRLRNTKVRIQKSWILSSS
jgi:hypothetical protein